MSWAYSKGGFVFLGAFLLAFSSVSINAAAFSVELSSNVSVPFGGDVTVFGKIVNTTAETINGTSWVINASLANNNFSQTTTAFGVASAAVNATFNVSANTSGIWGPSFLVLKVSNGTTTLFRAVKFRVTNTSTATIEFVGAVPPFSPGGMITAKITAKNWSGQPLRNQNINGTIFKADGPVTTWGMNSSGTNANGETLMNFSIPSDADASNYILAVEGRAGFIFFGVVRYSLSVATKDSAGGNKNAFAPGSVVTVESKLTYTNGTPISGSATKIEVTDPNSLLTTSSGSSYADGKFQYNYTASVSGSYKIRVIAGGQEQSGSFAARTLAALIITRETASFFREFAGKKLFPPGQNISLTILPTNVSSGEILATGSSSYDCGQNNFTVIDVYFANNQTSINSTINAGYLTFVPVVHTGTSVCGVELGLASNYVGVFGIKLGVRTGDAATTTAQGYFTIQRNGFSVEPSSEFGEGGFQALLLPGSNTTFKLTAFNITSGENMPGGNITNAWVKKITILSLSGGGGSEISGLESNFTFVNATQSDDGTPYLSGGPIPSVAGPQMISVMADVAGETNITADAFYFGKYLMGFGTPSGTRFEGGEGEGGGGHEGGRGGGMSIDCSGTTEFNVMVFDAKTFMPATSVSFLSVLSAKDEMTGSDISSCLTVTKGLTDSSGQAKINVTFSQSCTYSGFNFMFFNVSFQDKTDQIPAGFSCESMSMMPNTYNSLGQQRFSFSPTSNITVFVQSPSYTANSSRIVLGGNMSVAALINMNPSTGANVLTAITPIIVNITSSSGTSNATLYLHPSYFMSAGKPLTKWPNGFFELRTKVCDNATTALKGYAGACGTSSNSGFKVAAFDMWTDWWMGSASQNTYQPGQNVSNLGVFADLAPWHLPNVTQILIELINFESGKKYNSSSLQWFNGTPAYFPQSDIENLTVANFTIPSALKAGEYGGIVTVKNNAAPAESSEEFIFLSIKGLTVGMAPTEQWTAPNGHCAPAALYEQSWLQGRHEQIGTTDGWSLNNWTFINNTYLGIKAENMVGQLGFSTLVCTGPTLDTTNDMNQRSTNYTNFSVMVVANDTHSFVFLGNSSLQFQRNVTEINRVLPTQKIDLRDGYRTYLWTIDGAPFIRFVNVTTLNTGSGMGGTVSTNFAFGGSHRVREMVWLPMVAFRGSDGQSSAATRLANHAFNITEVAEMNTEGFGIKGKLPQSLNDYSITGGNWTDFEGNRTNADGLAFIPLNVTKSGRFMAFWKVNSTPAEKSTFKNSINFNVRGFNTQSTFVQLLPNTSKRIVLKANVSSLIVTTGGNATSGFAEGEVPAVFFNGSFTETASDQFVRDGITETFYFVVVNNSANANGYYGTGNLTKLYIDDDSMLMDSAQCSASQNAENSQTNELSNGACAGSSGAAVNYHTKVVESSSSRKILSYGSATQLGLTDWYINNTHAILNFYESSPSIPWAMVTSTTQRFGLRVCASTFANSAKNATFALKYNNWMQGRLASSQTTNITAFNLTHGDAINLPNQTSGSIYDGCLLTDMLPQSGSWSAGRNEIMGTATEIDLAGASTGVTEDMFAGPIEYLTSGRKTF